MCKRPFSPLWQWMKQIDPRAKWTGSTLYGDLKKGFEVSAVKKQLFVVLKGSTMYKDSSGDFVSKRVIPKVERKHLGKYLCVVFGRPHGKLVYQESFLKLRRRKSCLLRSYSGQTNLTIDFLFRRTKDRK